MRKLLLILLPFMIMLFLCSCSEYSEKDLLGKTSQEIINKYGEFDCVGKDADADGIYRNTSCGYTIRPSRSDFLGSQPELLLFIRFDENGIAVACTEGYRPGG